MRIIFVFGIISLFSDITYEGARSILGPFFLTLSATSASVGFITGFGEFLGYALRLLSGYLSDKTKKHYLFLFLGYSLNLLSIPFLSISKNWYFAGFLVFLERIGKAIRTPARDTILSFASERVGYGRGFAIHEALDQIGAILGPIFVALVLKFTKSYKISFLSLFIPAVFALTLLSLTRVEKITKIDEKKELGVDGKEEWEKNEGKKWGKSGKKFTIYILFIFFTLLGFPQYQIISYYFKSIGMRDELIPIFFAIAMGVDAISGIFFGFLFDKIKIFSLIFIPILSAILPFFAFSSHSFIIAVLIWGIVMGLWETIPKSYIALLTRSKRGTYFGVFHGVFGLSWFIGNFAMGILMENITYLIAFCVSMEFFGFIFLLFLIFLF